MRLLGLIVLTSLLLGLLVASPIIADEEMTFYPDTNDAGVDGRVWHFVGAGTTWSNLVTGSGVDGWSSVSVSDAHGFQSHLTALYIEIRRCIYVIDTSGLPDGCVVTGATFSVYGDSKDDASNNLPNSNVYSSNPASNTELEAGDYASVGSVAFCDTPISYGDFSLEGYNDYVFNDTGIAAISKTGVTKLSLRNVNYDVANNPPARSDIGNDYGRMRSWMCEKGEGFKPKLVVTYEIPGVPDCPTGFEGLMVNVQEIELVWDTSVNSSYYTVRGSYLEVPTDNESGYLVYTGSETSCNVTGLDLNSTIYYFSLWNIAGDNVSTCLEYLEIGGEDLEFNIEGSLGIISLGLGLALVLINFFWKKGILYLAVIPCMIGCLVEPSFRNAWFQSGCVLVMIWAVLAFFKSMTEGANG